MRSPAGLHIGSAVVELLIPHRRPFLLVDRVSAFELEPRARLRAARHVSMSEAVFAGHSPGMPIWPGALTLEGLGQSALLLLRLRALVEAAGGGSSAREEVAKALGNLDRGFRLHPGYRADPGHLRLDPPETLALGAAVDMKFLRPVLPGCLLEYEVTVTADFGDRVRFAALATVSEEPVAEGTFTAAVGLPPLPEP